MVQMKMMAMKIQLIVLYVNQQLKRAKGTLMGTGWPIPSMIGATGPELDSLHGTRSAVDSHGRNFGADSTDWSEDQWEEEEGGQAE